MTHTHETKKKIAKTQIFLLKHAYNNNNKNKKQKTIGEEKGWEWCGYLGWILGIITTCTGMVTGAQ